MLVRNSYLNALRGISYQHPHLWRFCGNGFIAQNLQRIICLSSVRRRHFAPICSSSIIGVFLLTVALLVALVASISSLWLVFNLVLAYFRDQMLVPFPFSCGYLGVTKPSIRMKKETLWVIVNTRNILVIIQWHSRLRDVCFCYCFVCSFVCLRWVCKHTKEYIPVSYTHLTLPTTPYV